MAFNVTVKPLTFFEIDEVVFWYEKQLPGSGKRFLYALDECIEKIRKQPENYLVISPPVRRILLKTFP